MSSTIPKEAIITFSGLWLNPLDPDFTMIDIEDIAHALSNQCRFTGHTKHFYSVAQHSCMVSDLAPYELRLDGLLHDASEAYLSDIARPIKHQNGFGDVYREVEDGLMEAIAQKFGIQWPMPPEIKEADNLMLATEIRDLMPLTDQYTIQRFDASEMPSTLKTWSPSRSKQEFLERYYDLTS